MAKSRSLSNSLCPLLTRLPFWGVEVAHASLLKARHLEREWYQNTLESNVKTVLVRYLTSSISPGDEFCINSTVASNLFHILKPVWLYTLPFSVCNSLAHSNSLWRLLVSSPHTAPLNKGYYRIQLSCTLIAEQLAHHNEQASGLSVRKTSHFPEKEAVYRQATDGFWSKLGPSFNCSKASAKLRQELPVSGWSSPLGVNGRRAMHSLQQGCITGSPPGQVSSANKSSVSATPHDLARTWFGLLRQTVSPHKAPCF